MRKGDTYGNHRRNIGWAYMPNIVNRRTGGLWALMSLLVLCSLFFLSDSIGDLFGWQVEDSDTLETLVVLALVVAVGLTGFEIRKILDRQRRLEDQIRAASGAFSELLEDYFEQWRLTPSERDVALLAIKGLSIADIARLRNTKEGTIKAQSNAIYRKAGVSGRLQLLSLFIEDLMSSAVVK